jgi:hypothetical protein
MDISSARITNAVYASALVAVWFVLFRVGLLGLIWTYPLLVVTCAMATVLAVYLLEGAPLARSLGATLVAVPAFVHSYYSSVMLRPHENDLPLVQLAHDLVAAGVVIGAIASFGFLRYRSMQSNQPLHPTPSAARPPRRG